MSKKKEGDRESPEYSQKHEAEWTDNSDGPVITAVAMRDINEVDRSESSEPHRKHARDGEQCVECNFGGFHCFF